MTNATPSTLTVTFSTLPTSIGSLTAVMTSFGGTSGERERRMNKKQKNSTFQKKNFKNRESVLHVLAESSQWLDRWCKGAEEEGGAKE